MGGAANVGICLDAGATGGGLGAVAWLREQFFVLPAGRAHDALNINEIYVLESFPIVAAVAALGDRLGGKRIIFLGNNAAAGNLFGASSRVPAVLASIGGLWRTVVCVAATCWIERARSAASSADAPSRDGGLLLTPNREGELSFPQ